MSSPFVLILIRELREHITGFRFAAVFGLTTLLMVQAAGVGSRDFELAQAGPWGTVDGLLDDDGNVRLHNLQSDNGITVRRAFPRMAFIAGSNDGSLPNQVRMAVHGMEEIVRAEGVHGSFRGSVPLDWAYIVSVLLSFAAGLLTYRSISGELEDNTLALMLSNSISRASVLLAKFAGAMIALTVGLCVSALVSVIVLRLVGPIHFSGAEWARLGLVLLAALPFVSCFVLIGLLCSVLSRNSTLSAIAFLFLWTILVFVVPNLGGIVGEQLVSIRSPREINEARHNLRDRILSRDPSQDESHARMDIVEARERLLLDYLTEQVGQVRVAQDLTRISPVSTFTYAIQDLTNTGIGRFERFIKNTRRFRRGLFEAALAADRKDPDSQHRYTPWKQGGNHFSHKTVDLGPATHFIDADPTSLEAIESATKDIGILVLCNIALFMLCFLKFMRQEVTAASAL